MEQRERKWTNSSSHAYLILRDRNSRECDKWTRVATVILFKDTIRIVLTSFFIVLLLSQTYSNTPFPGFDTVPPTCLCPSKFQSWKSTSKELCALQRPWVCMKHAGRWPRRSTSQARTMGCFTLPPTQRRNPIGLEWTELWYVLLYYSTFHSTILTLPPYTTITSQTLFSTSHPPILQSFPPFPPFPPLNIHIPLHYYILLIFFTNPKNK